MTPTHVLVKDFLTIKQNTLIEVKKEIWIADISANKGGYRLPRQAGVRIRVVSFPEYFRELSAEEIVKIKEAKELLKRYHLIPFEVIL